MLISIKENEKQIMENLLSQNMNFTYEFFITVLKKSLNSYFQTIKVEDIKDFYYNFLEESKPQNIFSKW